MHGNLRETDAIGRYGGEEFIVILPETSPEKALDIAERIRDAVDKYRFPREDTQPGGKLTVSIGLASYPGDAATSTDIIQAADEVLYTAKHLGRNRVVAANKPLFL
jgi:diguanylate cyclase (GGDEF)-like protein